MKKILFALLLTCLNCSITWSGTTGDINGDDKVGLQEAVHALQVTAGIATPDIVESPPAPVSKTGQTISYSPRDDGYFERGVTIPTPRFRDNGDGTVTDNLTGLIWLKNANADGNQRIWSQAFSCVTQLNNYGTMNGSDCGDTSNGGSHQTDWRLPNRFELESLINLAYYSPCMSNTHGDAKWSENDPFTNIRSGWYWSSSRYAFFADDYPWVVNLGTGEVDNKPNSGYAYIWPVRGGNY